MLAKNITINEGLAVCVLSGTRNRAINKLQIHKNKLLALQTGHQLVATAFIQFISEISTFGEMLASPLASS